MIISEYMLIVHSLSCKKVNAFGRTICIISAGCPSEHPEERGTLTRRAYYILFASRKDLPKVRHKSKRYPQMKRVEDSPRTKWGLLLLVVVFDEKLAYLQN
jgi:hypothetical protein